VLEIGGGSTAAFSRLPIPWPGVEREALDGCEVAAVAAAVAAASATGLWPYVDFVESVRGAYSILLVSTIDHPSREYLSSVQPITYFSRRRVSLTSVG
jgi:hypothetical protein